MSGPFSTGGSGHSGRVLLYCQQCGESFWWPADAAPIARCCACRYPFQGRTFAGEPVGAPKELKRA